MGHWQTLGRGVVVDVAVELPLLLPPDFDEDADVVDFRLPPLASVWNCPDESERNMLLVFSASADPIWAVDVDALMPVVAVEC